MVFIAAGIFLVVEFLLIFAIFRYRKTASSDDGSEPVQLYGSNPIELAWTIIPIMIVFVLCLATIRTIQVVQPTKNERPENALTVEVIGHRWWWEFRYPELDVVTANEMFVPKDRPIWLELGSADVIHSFWVPELQGKMDAIPGKTNYWRFTPEEVGTYLGQCAEYCGTQHANMLIRVEVSRKTGSMPGRRLRPRPRGRCVDRTSTRAGWSFSRTPARAVTPSPVSPTEPMPPISLI